MLSGNAPPGLTLLPPQPQLNGADGPLSPRQQQQQQPHETDTGTATGAGGLASPPSGRSTPSGLQGQPPPPLTPSSSALRLIFGTLRGSASAPMSPGLNSAASNSQLDLITKTHWKPDSEAGECFNLSCCKPFSFFERKHHCRRCGNIFCSSCCSYILRLNTNAELAEDGKPQKVCCICSREHQSVVPRDHRSSEAEDIEPLRKSIDQSVPLASQDSIYDGSDPQDDGQGGFKIRRRTRSLREMKGAVPGGRRLSIKQDAITTGNGSYVWSTF